MGKNLGGHSSSVTGVTFSFDGGALMSCTDAEVLMWDLTTQPPQQLFFRSSMAAHRSIVGLTPLIWSLHDHWIQVEQGEDHWVRHVCYIPPHYSPSTRILVSSVQAQTRIAVGCRDGHVIILAVPDQV
ncbi:hypothetical protein BS47DRAFT_1314031 [Hydnum rufescens UP504]|uniref:Uncharacterized protein n=1 Tax=Hydnum rufescens UP504 TaxID=1448309 RepID=A0A9P6B4R9_9AGAM|nr:hypothetical protein BS47DRAFT_1314031 [Hydnum rufescens UP504]